MGRRLLESLGYTVDVESDAESALARFRRSPDSFQALITDLTMPGMTGLDLIHQIRVERPDLPVLLMSGHADIGTPTDLQARRIEFLGKPFRRNALAHSLRTMLDRRGSTTRQ